MKKKWKDISFFFLIFLPSGFFGDFHLKKKNQNKIHASPQKMKLP